MNYHVLEATCESCGMKQRITIEGQTTEEVERFAGLLDGTSDLYRIPVPRDGSSLIGKCVSCPTGVFRCKIVEEST